ncbi:hypothetical protein HK097_008210 [Rhizophlyctis rosea]|uniref:Uncharacterized protein n=1 Tax=Rhizophlyctis rosea TaxID=64517 RepID=A0AAD5SJJ3_9FUNG|nr:hypothetical protein HK097_008210 [Rhizophlyctis rosea]
MKSNILDDEEDGADFKTLRPHTDDHERNLKKRKSSDDMGGKGLAGLLKLEALDGGGMSGTETTQQVHIESKKGDVEDDDENCTQRRYERHVQAKLIQWMNENLALNFTVSYPDCLFKCYQHIAQALPHSQMVMFFVTPYILALTPNAACYPNYSVTPDQLRTVHYDSYLSSDPAEE